MALIVVEFVTLFEPERSAIYTEESASVNIKQQLLCERKNNYKPLISSNEDNYIICKGLKHDNNRVFFYISF